MTNSLRATVVTATRDRAQRLAALLDALERQTLGTEAFEVLVIDDGSGDDTPRLLAQRAASGPLQLRVLRQERSAGPAAARNRGWREAQSAQIGFTDDDCEPTPEWLENLLGAQPTPDTVVQGRVLPNPAELEALSPFARTLEVTELSPHFQTANILYPRALLERLDGFDEGYGAPAGEDTDLGQRAMGAGIDAVFAPEALVYHAVHERGLANSLRDALRATDCVKAYRDHPHLREHLENGLFFHRSHPLLAQAAIGLWAARRTPSAALLALPYAAHLAKRSRAANGGLHLAPYFVARDVVEIAATLRGAWRYRVTVL